MKHVVKGFGQWINESDNSRPGRNTEIGLVELIDGWVQANHQNDLVLIQVDISGSADALTEGGIMITIDPSEAEIGEAQWDGTKYSELYENGKRVTEEDLDAGGEEFY